jgi:hypothetical protein
VTSENDAFNRASYGKIADRYAKFRPEYPDALFGAVLAHVRSFTTALDCATGTGQAAIKLTPHFHRVLASDSSAGQIEQLPRAKGLHGFVSEAEELPIRDHSVDLVTVAQAVHWFDIERFWQEVARIGADQAVIAIWGYGFFTVSPEVDEIVMRELREPVAPYWGSGNLILLDEYRTISFPFEELPAPRIDISQHWTLDRLLAYLGTWSALNRHEQEHGPGLLPRAKAALQEVWPNGQVLEVRMPLTLRIGRL